MSEIVGVGRFVCFSESRNACRMEAFSSPSQQNAHFAIFRNVISMAFSDTVLLCQSLTCIWIIVKYLKNISKKCMRVSNLPNRVDGHKFYVHFLRILRTCKSVRIDSLYDHYQFFWPMLNLMTILTSKLGI